jgi:hypothetical protein
MADNYMNHTENGCMDWGDTIEQDSQFIILPEGDYTFTVTNFERGRHAGSEKIPPCNKALLTLEVKTKEGTATVFTDLLLYRSMEWKISSFFRAIGQKKHGERLVMDWSKVLGARGRARIAPTTYIGKQDGKEHEKNEVVRYYDYDPSKMQEDEANEFMTIPEGADDELPFN